MEDHLIYNEIRGTDEFNYEDEDQINADREIYLSEQVTAFKVKVYYRLIRNYCHKLNLALHQLEVLKMSLMKKRKDSSSFNDSSVCESLQQH